MTNAIIPCIYKTMNLDTGVRKSARPANILLNSTYVSADFSIKIWINVSIRLVLCLNNAGTTPNSGNNSRSRYKLRNSMETTTTLNNANFAMTYSHVWSMKHVDTWWCARLATNICALNRIVKKLGVPYANNLASIIYMLILFYRDHDFKFYLFLLLLNFIRNSFKMIL